MSKYSYTSPHDEYAFPRRRKKKISIFRVALILVFIFGVACIGILYFIFFGSFWKVSSIQVEGSRLLEDSSLISSAIAEMHTKGSIMRMLGHDNILFWMFRENPMTISRIPEVKEISITTDFSRTTVHLKVNERVVRAVVCGSDTSECYAIDDDGKIFSRVPWIEGTLIPRFEGTPNEPITIGKKYFRKDDWFNNVLTTVTILEKKGFVPSLVRIRSEGTEEWEAMMPSGTLFYFSLNFVPKDLEKIIDDIARRVVISEISYFDLRVENRVYYK